MSNPLSKVLCFVDQVYSMIMHTKSSEYLYQMATGVNRVGSKRSGEREREREQRVNRVRGGILDRNSNGVGWKCRY